MDEYIEKRIEYRALTLDGCSSIIEAIDHYKAGNFNEAHARAKIYMEAYGIKAREALRTITIDEHSHSLSFIVITSLGASPALARCLSSILHQEPQPSNIVIVLNGCKLSSQAQSLLDSHSVRHAIISIPLNILPSEARNLGAHAATGDWIAFIDDDGFISAGYTASLTRLISSKEFIACRGKVVPIDQKLSAPKHYDLGEKIKPASIEVEGNLVFNKNAFFLSKGFNSLMYAHEGRELYNRCTSFLSPACILYSPSLVLHHDPSSGDKLDSKLQRNALARHYLKEMKNLARLGEQPKRLIVVLINKSSSEHLSSLLMSLRSLSRSQWKTDVLVLSRDTQSALAVSSLYRPLLNIKVLSQVKTAIDYLERAEDCLVVALATCSVFPLKSFNRILPAMLRESSQELLTNSGLVEGIGSYFPLGSRLQSSPGKSAIKNYIVNQYLLYKAGHAKLKKPILVASFYTPDDYYRAKAVALARQLDALGVDHCIKEISIPAGLKWPDICRKKIQYIFNAFREGYDRYEKIAWIDADCSLEHFPSFLLDFQVDVMGFARGFPHSTHSIKVRTRFWEPCFFVFTTNAKCQAFLKHASDLEKQATSINATDDYFFEEAWRKNRDSLTLFCIPGEYSTRRMREGTIRSQYRAQGVFFEFGESGNVDEFKGKVEQHDIEKNSSITNASNNTCGIKPHAKPVESLISLTRKDQLALTRPEATILQGMHEIYREQVKSLIAYEGQEHYISLFWWIRPAPGNMGDWLSPYILHKLTGLSVAYSNSNESRLVALGSIGRYIQAHHTIWGTGISTRETVLNPNGNYLAVRGPHTAQALRDSGGKAIDIFGDPGILMKYIYAPIKLKNAAFRYGFVRHYIHQDVPLTFEDGIEDLNILVSSAASIENFVNRLASYDAVLTTSLHVIILCHAYQIPCRLVALKSQVRPVHGDGIKYKDFYEGAGLRYIPHAPLGDHVSCKDFDSLVSDVFAPDSYGTSLRNSLINELRNNPYSIISAKTTERSC